jgi:serine/threonine protein kinase
VLPPGALLDRYEIVAPLGEGGMGNVFAARDLILGRDVAIKVLRDVEPGAAERLLREAKAAAAVRHPNIVVVYDFGIQNGTTYLVMEHIDGKSLRDHLPSAAPLGRKVRWLLDIARALGAIHATGLVHRDIKPHNILIDGDGRARLIDLGLAAYRGTSNRVGAGTPGYSAPEQLAGHVDARSDQYAWGITAFELLVGKRPTGEELAGSDLPRPLLDAIARTIEHNAERRHESMAALAVLLEPYAERPTITRQVTASPPPVAQPARPRIRPSYALDVAVLALAFGVWLVASGARPRATAAESPTCVELTTSDAFDERELSGLRGAAPAIKVCLDAYPTAPQQLTVSVQYETNAPARKVLRPAANIPREFARCAQVALDAIDTRPRVTPMTLNAYYELIDPR